MISNPRFTDFVKSDFLHLELREILQSEPSILLGVSDEAKDVLKSLEIHTIFDLGMSKFFIAAGMLSSVSDIPPNLIARYGQVPSEMVKIDYRDKDVREMLNEKVFILMGISAGVAGEILAELGIDTIREMALWNPYLIAKILIALSLKPEGLPESDAESPADLIPKTGEYPTDKVFYKSIVLIDAPKFKSKKAAGIKPAVNLIDLNAPIDLANETQGFTSPATGAILTYSQTWFPKAIALGQLLYSLALAPGESTKIAVIDFARRSSGSTQEDISQTENLSNTMVQSRSISEIASAVASEVQSGDSTSTSSSDSQSIGGAAGGFVSPVLFGVAAGASHNETTANTFTTSSGERNLTAKNQQHISNSTQQNAFSERNKKAAIITEASQEEREQITTRTVTNYNHMHALSIQYYEVVQLYETQVRVEKCERCLFIPLKVFNFDERIISRFKSSLFRAALNQRIKQLLVYSTGSVSVKLELKPAYGFIEED